MSGLLIDMLLRVPIPGTIVYPVAREGDPPPIRDCIAEMTISEAITLRDAITAALPYRKRSAKPKPETAKKAKGEVA